MEWNFENKTDINSVNGYDEFDEFFDENNSEKWKGLNNEEKKQLVEDLFNVYREKDVFPIRYYNSEGVKAEIQKCIDKDVEWDGKTLNLRNNQGNSLCRFIFPNLMKVQSLGRPNNSMWDKFYDDHKLKRAIEFCMKFDTKAHPVKLLGGLRLIGGNVPTNFSSMRAKAMYEKYCPENGIIYDYASGFGGRLLGALSSKKNYKYLGIEPCKETFEGLNTLGEQIESVTGRTNSYALYNDVSEDFMIKENYVDFAFSSPPYFSLEQYSEEKTQCYNKFDNLEDWFEGYVKPTIKNTYKMLKEDRYYAVNIADFNMGREKVELVNKWIEMSEEAGFEYVKNIPMKLTTRRGKGHRDEIGKEKLKKEGIFLFKKPIKDKI